MSDRTPSSGLLDVWCELPPGLIDADEPDGLFERVNGEWQARHTGAAPSLLKALANEAERECSSLIAAQLSSGSSGVGSQRPEPVAALHRIFVSEFDSDAERRSCRSDIEEALQLTSRLELTLLLAKWTRRGYASPLYVRVRPTGEGDPAIVVPALRSSPLPPEDFHDVERSAAYLRHMQAILGYIGANVPADRVRRAIEIDKALWVGGSMGGASPAASLEFPWELYLRSVVGPRERPWIYQVPGVARQRMATWWAGTLQQLSDWMVCRLAYEFAPFVSESSFVENSKFFAGRVLGVNRPRPRPARFVSLVKTVMPDELAELYTHRVHDPDTLDRARDLGESLRDAALGWAASMTERGVARSELADTLKTLRLEFGAECGHRSARDRRASVPACVSDSFKLARAGEVAEELLAIDDPGRADRWKVHSYTAAAYYQRSCNKVVVPWALIREPLIGPGVSDLQAYALFGTLVAHEMAHAVLPSSSAEWERFVERALLTRTLIRLDPESTETISERPNQVRYRELAADAIGYAWAMRALVAKLREPESGTVKPTRATVSRRFMTLWATRWRGRNRVATEGFRHIDKHPHPVMRCDAAPTYLTEIDTADVGSGGNDRVHNPV